ncbi:GGDEF domain-containing protein [Noviherbaspirillum sp. UKPF54]|uniref:GGDEF domain-containing protein n=1 Tax=Noviherbaspirillum sp. UKPF54 TaxID=2601898 RepID=UPI0011B1BFBD|nr:GGDEF domain-containing protein [Noviherbaspirillum sp. UKPF54]QDZ29845.1 diguanylate cyclase [Noviherbaspirillum sp. UKPF54]
MNSDADLAKPFRPLRRQVVAWALLYSVLFTLLMTAVLIGINYVDEREAALEQLRFAAASYRKSLANSVWDLDMPAVRLQLDALANFPMVGHATLSTSIGQTIQVGKQAADAEGALTWQEALFSPERPDQIVAQLLLHVDRHAFLHRLQVDAVRVLGAEAVKGVAFGLLMAWLISTLVTRHLSHMAGQVSLLRPTALGRSIVLDRAQRPYRDELDQLCHAFNGLHGQLSGYINRQRELEMELRTHRDSLAGMVAERTHSLERLRSFHALVIRVLTRFINLPPAQASSAVDHGLGTFREYFSASRCLLLTHDRRRRGFRVENGWPAPRMHGVQNDVFLSEEMLPRRLLANHQSRVWLCGDSGDGDARLLTLFGDDAYTLVGVEVHGNTIGLLALTGCVIAPDSEKAGLLELAARVSANMLDHKAAQLNLLEAQQALQRANRELHRLCRHDPLTGLANRRHFDDIKDVEFRRALRSDAPLSVLMCDIDEFKRYNDTYGHAQGDRCLTALAAALTPLFRRVDEVLVRLGGEEFAVLLPQVDTRQALELAERVRQAAWDMNLPHESSSVADRVTVSVGVASLKPGRHKDFDMLLQEADLALYGAKEGRNRVMLSA